MELCWYVGASPAVSSMQAAEDQEEANSFLRSMQGEVLARMEAKKV